jgi:hypothetical protein
MLRRTKRTGLSGILSQNFQARLATAGLFFAQIVQIAQASGLNVGPFGVASERGDHIAALRTDLETLGASIGDQALDQPRGDAVAFELWRDQGVVSHACAAALDPGQPTDQIAAWNVGMIFAMVAVFVAGDSEAFHAWSPALDGAVAPRKG